jgi:predicted nucleic acid-binding protein
VSEPPITARVVDGSALAAFALGSRYVAALVALAERADERLQLIVPCSALVEGARSGLDDRLTDLLVGAAGIVFLPLDTEQARAIAKLERAVPGAPPDLPEADAAVSASAAGVPVLTTDPHRYQPLAGLVELDVVP